MRRKNPHFLLEIEAMPATSGTPISRLKKVLKMLLWHRFKCRSVQELPADGPGTAPGEKPPHEAGGEKQ
jgi:hypothetical protein